RGPAGARRRAGGGLPGAHGPRVPAGRALPRALPCAAAIPAAVRPRGRALRADAARAGIGVPRRPRAPQGGRDRDPAGRAVRPDQDFPTRRRTGGSMENAPLRLITASPLERLARTLEALLVVASQPLSVEELAEAASDDAARVESALDLLSERYAEGRSGIV